MPTSEERRFSELVADITADGGKPSEAQRGELRALKRTADKELRRAITTLLGDEPKPKSGDRFSAGAERAHPKQTTYPILEDYYKEMNL